MADLVVIDGVQYKRVTAERLGLLLKKAPAPTGAPSANKTREPGSVRRGGQKNATPPRPGQ